MLFEIKGVRNMGLSASQARLLNLTARMHDIEYKAQNLEAQKLQMSNESTHVYQEYEDAMNKQKMQLKSIGADGSASYKDVTGSSLSTAGYVFEVVSGAKAGMLYTTVNNAATAAGVTLSAAAKNDSAGTAVDGNAETVTNLIQAGFIVLVKCPQNASGGFIKPADGTLVSTFKSANADAYETNVATDTSLQEVSDETELKKAEAKYEADMRKIDAKDKKFDTDLAAMETERNAIKTEMETLKTVAKDNVDRTFKLFS